MANLFKGKEGDLRDSPVFEPHPTDDELEMYSMGRASELETIRIEEHVLLCGYCQDRLQDADEFVALMKDTTNEIAAREDAALDKQGRARTVAGAVERMGTPVITGLAAIVAVTIGFAVYQNQRAVSTPTGEAAIHLVANRGAGMTPVIGSNASSVLLSMDTSGLPEERLAVVVVAEDGSPVWASQVEPRNNRALASVRQSLRAGQYFCRLSSKSVLLREFAFRVQ